jgi:stage V sporulation protein G
VEITEVRIKLMDDTSDRLRSFCSITFDDCFVVRDLKIIEGSNGPFVAMPSRKLTSHCQQCGCKNHLRSGYCNQCGSRLKDDGGVRDHDGRTKLYADIAHPINSECREMIQNRVIHEYQTELERSKDPGYTSRYDEYYGDAGEEGANYDDVPTPQQGAASEKKPQEKPQENAHIEPAESKPRGPHRAPSSQPASHPPKEGGGFGTGVF